MDCEYFLVVCPAGVDNGQNFPGTLFGSKKHVKLSSRVLLGNPLHGGTQRAKTGMFRYGMFRKREKVY